MRTRTRDLRALAGLVLPSPQRAAGVFGIALFYELLLMIARAVAGWSPLTLGTGPVLLVLHAAVAAAAIELLLRGLLQGALPFMGVGAALSLVFPAAVEYLAGSARGDVLWEVAFGIGFVFARAASGSVFPCMALRFVQYLIVPAFAVVHL